MIRSPNCGDCVKKNLEVIMKSSPNPTSQLNPVEVVQRNIEDANLYPLRFDFYHKLFNKLDAIGQPDSQKDPKFRSYHDCRIVMQREFHMDRREIQAAWIDMKLRKMIIFKRRGLVLINGGKT